jgi:prepilin-type N-terminal cleavage/methylation domain-containing protein
MNANITGRTIDGFSLVEMAIVLAIVALLMAGLLPTLSSQVEQQRMNETRKQLAEVQQALIGYAIINGRLPCPADGTIATGLANAGMEAKTGSNCTNVSGNAAWGVLPWATLGVSETDAWGRRFSYRVTAAFADSTDGTGTTGSSCAVTTGISFQLCSNANLTILSSAGGTNVASDIPAVVVSHGSNGCGAYMPTGNTIPIAAGAGIGGDCSNAGNDQVENADNNNTLVNHESATNFDDLLVWISPSVLINRMVTASRLP